MGSVATSTIRGSASLLLRQAVLTVVGFGSGIILARLLAPSDFGVFGVSTALVGVVSMLSSVGAASAIVQRREHLAEDERAAIFTLELGIGILGAAALWATSDVVTRLMQFPPDAVWVTRALAIGLVLAAPTSMSMAALERSLRFGTLAWIDVVAMGAYYLAAVTGALTGAGYWSFVGAQLTSSALRCALAYSQAPWCVRLRLPGRGAAALMRFGLLFQGGQWTSLVRENLIAFVSGPLFGPALTGQLMWANTIAYSASGAFTQVVSQVSFPSLSRLEREEDREVFVSSALRWLLLVLACSLAVTCGVGQRLVQVVYSSTWLPALAALYLLSGRMVCGNITSLGIATLNAQGLPGLSLRILLAWTGFEVVCAVAGGTFFGWSGIAAGLLCSILLPTVWLLVVLPLDRRQLVRDVLLAGASALSAVVCAQVALGIVDGLSGLLVGAAAGVVGFGVTVLILGGSTLAVEVRGAAQMLGALLPPVDGAGPLRSVSLLGDALRPFGALKRRVSSAVTLACTSFGRQAP